MKRVVPIVAVLIALVACGGFKILTGDQASSVLPGKADTPQGLQFLPDSSGKQPASQVAKDQDQQDKLTSYGLENAYASFYANSAAVNVLSQPNTPADPTAHIVAMLAEVFKTVDGAHKALELNYQKDTVGTDVKKISVASLGDETLGESGTQANFPFPGYLVYWRVGNTIFAVLDAGGPTAGSSLDTVLTYARAMQARVQKI